jgi:hypothetical protein
VSHYFTIVAEWIEASDAAERADALERIRKAELDAGAQGRAKGRGAPVDALTWIQSRPGAAFWPHIVRKSLAKGAARTLLLPRS